ncbi:MAG: DUF1016 family protein [Porphyromonadaceae bacterium]|nr:MAG: DUF1016 family protein [Porphyromonadaceae bacterium]
MNFSDLISIIQQTDGFLKQRAYQAVNQSLTIRNWLYGMYIVEFEQKGEDSAKYGNSLLRELSVRLKKEGYKALGERDLRRYRQFYLSYPHIWQSLTAESSLLQIWQSLTAESKEATKFQRVAIIDQVIGNRIPNLAGIDAEILIKRLSFTHFAELIEVEDQLKRTFYEIECIKGNWSVRELQRQIGSLLYERTGLSKSKEKMIQLANKGAVKLVADDIIRDPYVFEFLGLKQSEVIPETGFEELLIRHLQEYLLELGKGFCFEARQKRITIDNKHYHIDLVFYHKILKCNILIELKIRKFEHTDASQLRVYLNYWKKYELNPGDALPVGILLCTDKDQELVEFATSGIDEQLFISKYLVELPTKEELKLFIRHEINALSHH